MGFMKFVAGMLPVCLLSSCLIENDMSYPRVYGNITAFEVQGQLASKIDATGRTVSIELSETADITALEITSFSISEGARCEDPAIAVGNTIDLSSPVTVVISTYQDYEWTISANMPVERYVRCDNQADDAVFDLENRTVSVNVTQYQDLSSVRITAMKLGIEGSKIYHGSSAEECTFPMTIDCSSANTFRVETGGVSDTWTLTVAQRNVSPSVLSADAWCYHADITAEFASSDGSQLPVLQYRKQSDSSWTDVAVESSDVDGITVTKSITGLQEGTAYSVRLVLDSTEGKSVDFTTGTPDQIENMDFDDWYSDTSGSREIWYPNLNAATEVWGTANPGAGSFVGSLTTPSDFVCEAGQGDGKRSARLESKNALIAFAAGNIFTGRFGRINGLGAELYWGTPFTARPSALKGYYSYAPRLINKVKAPYESLENTMDNCQILVMLTDWEGPFMINTTDNVFVDQENDEHIIAYGKIESDEDTGGQYKEFTLPLTYRRTDATPKYAVVVACSSYKGDYFTGGEGSVMYVDEFEFVYE